MGVRRFGRVNWLGVTTLCKREIYRFMAVWTQTVAAPLVTAGLFLAVFSLMVGRGDGLDIALLYALINFIATIAILKFFRYRSLDVALSQMALRRALDGEEDD